MMTQIKNVHRIGLCYKELKSNDRLVRFHEKFYAKRIKSYYLAESVNWYSLRRS